TGLTAPPSPSGMTTAIAASTEGTIRLALAAAAPAAEVSARTLAAGGGKRGQFRPGPPAARQREDGGTSHRFPPLRKLSRPQPESGPANCPKKKGVVRLAVLCDLDGEP